MKRVKKGVLLVSVFIYVFLTNFLQIFSLVDTKKVLAAQNLTTWYSKTGTNNPANWSASRFRFETPFQLRDTATDTVYKTTANSETVFNNQTKHSQRRSGWFYYWPGEGTGPSLNDKSQCMGGFVLRLHGKEKAADKAELYAVGAKKSDNDANACYVPDTDDVDGQGDDPNDDWEYMVFKSYVNREGSTYEGVLDRATMRQAFAMFKWENSQNITVYDAGRSVGPVSGPALDDIADSLGQDFVDKHKDLIMSTSDCGKDSQDLKAFIAINPEERSVGRLYFDRPDDGDGFKDYWDGGQFTCIFGRDLTSNQTGLAGTTSGSSNLVYVALPEKSTTDGEEGGDTPEEDTEVGETGDPDCDGGSLSWMVCPLVNGLASLADGIVTTFLRPILRAEILALPGSGGQEHAALYEVWKGFRNIANALLILAFMAIIVSTAISSE